MKYSITISVKVLTLLLLILAGCSTGQVRKLAVPVPGGGHHVMTTRAVEPSFRGAAIDGTRTFTWVFHLPQGTTVSNWWWDLQRTTNLVTWTTIRSNVVGTIDVLITNDVEYFRLKGRL